MRINLLIITAVCFWVPSVSTAQNSIDNDSAVANQQSQSELTIDGILQNDPTQPQSTSENQGSDTPNEEEGQPKAGPKYEAYINLVNEGRALNVAIDRMYGSMPIGFPELQREHNLKLEQMKARQKSLASQVKDAAVEAYEESPNVDEDLVKLIINRMFISVAPKLDNQKFDPALAFKLCGLLSQNGIESRGLYYQGFRAAFALQDFEQAEKMIDKVEEFSQSELPPTVRERLNESKNKWARELEIRRLEAATDDLPQVKIETSAGDFVVELFENHAPQTVANFINLVEKGFYDGLTFHLVKQGVLAQGGCPNGNGTGDAGYKIKCECYRDEIRHHFAGTLSMATNGRDTGGSQFFISHQPNPGLDGKYTVFGRVIENQPVIYDLNTVDRSQIRPGKNEPTVIQRITVLRKRDHIYEPTMVVAEATQDSAPSLLVPEDPGGQPNENTTPDPANPAQNSTENGGSGDGTVFETVPNPSPSSSGGN